MEEPVKDLEGLFLYSGQLDNLRDTAKFLAKNGGASERTISSMVADYAKYRAELVKVLRDDLAERVDVYVPSLSDAPTLDEVVYVSSSLARWMDLAHQTPQFLLAQQVAAANAVEVGSKVEQVLGRKPGQLLDAPAGGLGQYI